MAEKISIKVKGNLRQVKKAINALAAAPTTEIPLRDADARAKLKLKGKK